MDWKKQKSVLCLCKKLLRNFIKNDAWRLASDLIEVARAIDLPEVYEIHKGNFILHPEKSFYPKEMGILQQAIRDFKIRIV